MNLVNGKPCDVISIHDRGLLYGQSLFETIAIVNAEPKLLDQHLERLKHGAHILGIPFQRDTIETELSLAIEGTAKGVARLTLTMGESGRGYLNPSNPEPNRIISVHAYPEYNESLWREGIVLGLSEHKLSQTSSMTGLKHGNRLDQITARSQWQEAWHEALLLDQEDKVIEATSANIFIVSGSQLLTPILTGNAVEGVMRNFIMQLAQDIGLSAKAVSLSLEDVHQADALFITNALIGVWPVKQFMHRTFSDFTIANKLIDQLLSNEIIPHP